MQQLRCRDLQGGDLLLKANDGRIVSKIISFSERLRGQSNPLITHAGVMFDGIYIIEARGGGLQANDLRVNGMHCGYIAYRPANRALGRGAAECAKMLLDIQQKQGTIKYNLLGLPGAVSPGGLGAPKRASTMDSLLQGLLTGRGSPFFCSQFVVYVYQFVAEQNRIAASQMFNADDAKVSPSTLASLLQRNRWFTELGYLMPGER